MADADGEVSAEADGDGEPVLLGEVLPLGVPVADEEADAEADADALEEAELLPDGDAEAEADPDAEGDAEAEPEGEAEGGVVGTTGITGATDTTGTGATVGSPGAVASEGAIGVSVSTFFRTSGTFQAPPLSSAAAPGSGRTAPRMGPTPIGETRTTAPVCGATTTSPPPM